MKRLILTVFAVGFLAVSCGGWGGNIKKVQNGMFPNYDDTITVGKALENSKFLKDGKWKAVEMGGRNYVTYTVKFTGEQIKGYLQEAETMISDFKNRYNYWVAYQFNTSISKWRNASADANRLASLTSLSSDEVKQVRESFKDIESLMIKPDDIEPLVTITGYELVLSFVMSQDGANFTPNMIESTTYATIKCLNNLKVEYHTGDIEDVQTFLAYIYTDKRPIFIGLM
jgi:hypothetical protein